VHNGDIARGGKRLPLFSSKAEFPRTRRDIAEWTHPDIGVTMDAYVHPSGFNALV
jgi:hypothetical protein